MVSLHLNVPEDLAKRLKARAKENGYEDVERFAEALLRADAEEQFVDDDLEALLLERIDDPTPPIEFTPAFEREFFRQAQERRSSRNTK